MQSTPFKEVRNVMPTVKVYIPGTPGQYPVIIEPGLLEHAAEHLTAYAGHQVAIVTDDNVAPLYLEHLMTELSSAGITGCSIVLPNGEPTKCQDSLNQVYDFLLDHRITRADAVLALGGGVIGDLTGFAAATYLRGTHFIQVPTTLLSQVDSSVGGKVAVNHPRGKNLLGAFYQPELVLIDTETLNTLDARQIGAGLGEVIKYGCIMDRDLFAMIEYCGCRPGLVSLYPEIIARCISLKAQVVAEDPFDTGHRMILNFGHTLAHAIENAAGYGTFLHGEAVCLGMLAAADWGEQLGCTSPGIRERILKLLENYQLPTVLPDTLSADRLFPSMVLDKKSVGKEIRIVLLDDIGSCHVTKLPAERLLSLMEHLS